MKLMHKTYFTQPGSLTIVKGDEIGERMIIDHAISDDAEDRDGDDISMDAWQTDNYLRNPIVLEGHNSALPAIGKCIELYKAGNQLRAKTEFAPTERGKMFYELYKGGFMGAFSVGFIADEYTPKGSGRGAHISKCELLEYSCVTVPANPRALKGVEYDEKSGAVISKGNLDKLKQAQALLAEVVKSAEPEDDDETDEDDETEKDLKALLFDALKACK